MNEITRFLTPELTSAVGWTLLHSLWQGMFVALVLALVMVFLRRQPPQLRYLVGLSGLGVMLLTSLSTFLWLYRPRIPFHRLRQALSEVVVDLDRVENRVERLFSAGGRSIPDLMGDFLQDQLPLIVTAWCLGVCLLTLRMLAQWTLVQRLRYSRSHPAAEEWINRVQVLAARMGIRRPVALRESLRIHTPMVMGVFKPLILVPAGLLAQLPPEQVESALIHELAHIRRHDYLVNLLQAAVEILFFFNPAVWWISSLVRAEREHCCDDTAVNMIGDEVVLVETLASLEEYRGRHVGLAMSLTGTRGSVLGRIQRLLYGEQLLRLPYRLFSGIAVVGCLLVLAAFRLPEPRFHEVEFYEEDAPEFEEFPEEEESYADPNEEEMMMLDTVPPAGSENAEIRRLQQEYEQQVAELQKQYRDLVRQRILMEKEIQQIQSEESTGNLAVSKKQKQLERERLEKEKALEIRRIQLEEQFLTQGRQLRQLEQSLDSESDKENPSQDKLKQLQASVQKLQQETQLKEQQLEKLSQELEQLGQDASLQDQQLWNQQSLTSKDIQLRVNHKEEDLLELEARIQELEHKREMLRFELELKIQELEVRQGSNQE